MCEGIALLGHLDRQHFGGFVEGVTVKCCARADENDAATIFRIDAGDIAGDADIAETVERAFVDAKVTVNPFVAGSYSALAERTLASA